MCDNPPSYRAKRIRALAPENELDFVIPAGGHSADHCISFAMKSMMVYGLLLQCTRLGGVQMDGAG